MITIKKPDKKSLQYLGIIMIMAILVCIGYFYYLFKTEVKEPEEKPEEKPETLIERQLRTINELRGKAEPLTEEEIQEQLDELDRLHQESQ